LIFGIASLLPVGAATRSRSGFVPKQKANGQRGADFGYRLLWRKAGKRVILDVVYRLQEFDRDLARKTVASISNFIQSLEVSWHFDPFLHQKDEPAPI